MTQQTNETEYDVVVRQVILYTLRVPATSADEARQRAESMWNDMGDADTIDYETNRTVTVLGAAAAEQN